MTNDPPDSVCSKCGKAITGESPAGDPSQRKPCPDCGSTARNYTLHAGTGRFLVTGGEAQFRVVTYPQRLLSTAKCLIDDGQYGIAVVVCHMACEIAAERSLSESFSTRGIQYLGEAIMDFLNGYNLANNRIRKLYTALTGDEVEKQPFWPKFCESATRRNKIIHAGVIVGKAEAEETLNATNALIAHLNQ